MIRRYLRIFVFILAILVLLATCVAVNRQMTLARNLPLPVREEILIAPDVTVTRVSTDYHQAVISSYGVSSPRYELLLSAQVNGQVQFVADNFEPGKRLRQGEILLQLEDSAYRSAVATAQKNLSDARLALLEEERMGVQAAIEWEVSEMSGYPESELVLRSPQLDVAHAAVVEAEAALESARSNLSRTRIVAPFDALVIDRRVSPGSYVQSGNEIALLYSTDRSEINLGLTEQEWQFVPDITLPGNDSRSVKLSDMSNKSSWSGRLLRVTQHLDETTRQRSLILAVDNPLDLDPPLFPGTFVQATITNPSSDLLWRLPGSAYSQKGEIWYVTPRNTLDFFTTTPVFRDHDSVFLLPPEELATEVQRVVIHPLSSYLRGMKVNPVEEQNHE